MPKPHPFDQEFNLTTEQREQFKRDGFVKLSGFLNTDAIRMLQRRADMQSDHGISTSPQSASHFKRSHYNLDTDKGKFFDLLERSYFRQALIDLTGHDLFLTYDILFELEKNVSTGFAWHVGVRSFGHVSFGDFSCTMWAPLHPVDSNGQRGGMAYIPEDLLSGDFVYAAEEALVKALKAREQAGTKTSISDYFRLRNGILNSPGMSELLEAHQVEDDFNPGDVFLFTKTVIHRSIMLGEGRLDRRTACVLRFVDINARYDASGARSIAFPLKQYGKDCPKSMFTALQHTEMAEAGTKDGDLIAQSAYFDNPERRMIRGT